MKLRVSLGLVVVRLARSMSRWFLTVSLPYLQIAYPSGWCSIEEHGVSGSDLWSSIGSFSDGDYSRSWICNYVSIGRAWLM
jgi:hypothetical protein